MRSPDARRPARLLLLLSLCLAPISAAPEAWAAPDRPAASVGRMGAPGAPDRVAPSRAGQLLVGLSAQARVAPGAALGGTRVLSTIPQLGVALVETGADVAASAAGLATAGLVQWAEPNYVLAPDAAPYPNDPYYALYQSGYLDRLGMPAAWVTSTGRSEIIIAVIDTGVDINHPDLQAGIWINPGEIPGNGIDDDGNGFVDDVNGWSFVDDSNQLTDGMGHGTHVAGIAAARINNSTGIAGMAGNATIMPVKVFPTSPPYIGTYYDLIRAIIYATDNGARVINLSLGASSYSRGEEAAVHYAWSHGAVVVAAAGNDGSQAVHYPSAHPHAIAVAATIGASPFISPDSRAGYSNWGSWVALAAPGSNIYSTVPGNGYTYMTGTSMATPHVAGLAALVLSVNPSLTPDAVRQLLVDNGDALTDGSWDLGGGQSYRPVRINAGRTLAAVQAGALPSPDPGPQLDAWPAGCVDLITDGGFESGLGAWQSGGAVELVTSKAYSGTHSLHFIGGPNTRGVLTRTVTLPDSPAQGTLWFAYRIETSDNGWGNSLTFPYADWMQVALRTTQGLTITSLLRTGNTADGANHGGLQWDEYFYRMQPADFVAPHRTGPDVSLVFSAGNDGNSFPTDFYLDAVRWCVAAGTNPYFAHTQFLPLAQN